MSIENIEKNIINKLKSTITELKIEGFPDNPSEYKLLHPKGAILVHFQGANYDKPREQAFIQQGVSLSFGLTLLVKSLRDRSGGYAYINSIISTLTGFAPAGCGKMHPTRVAFLTEESGIWQYALSFSVSTENYGV